MGRWNNGEKGFPEIAKFHQKTGPVIDSQSIRCLRSGSTFCAHWKADNAGMLDDQRAFVGRTTAGESSGEDEKLGIAIAPPKKLQCASVPLPQLWENMGNSNRSGCLTGRNVRSGLRNKCRTRRKSKFKTHLREE